MDIAKMILFLAIMTILPYLIGTSCQTGKIKAGGREIFEKWNFGMVLMYALFELWVLIGTFGKFTLRRVSVIYLLTLLLIILCGMVFKLRKNGVQGCPVRHIHINLWAWVVMVLVIVGVVYQMVYVCANMYIDDDDAYYVGMAVTSYFSDTISVNHPYLGTPVELKMMANYVLSPYPIYCAMWSQLLSLHPAILMRSILPAVNIAWCYIVYYLLSGVLLKKFSLRMEFMLLVILANLFGAYSDVSSSVFLLTRIWQGKGVIAAIFIPLFWYIWMRLRKEKQKTQLWVLMFMAVFGACLCSSMALFLCPILLGAFGLEYLIEKRNWKSVGKLIVCALPCLVLAIMELYLIYK